MPRTRENRRRAIPPEEEIPARLATGQVARLLGVSLMTVRKWRYAGLIVPVEIFRYRNQDFAIYDGEEIRRFSNETFHPRPGARLHKPVPTREPVVYKIEDGYTRERVNL